MKTTINTTNKSIVKRIIASVMTGAIMISAGSTAVVTANAASISQSSVGAPVPSEVSDGFFAGASTLVSVITKTHPVAGIISSGILGAFKAFYGNATKVPQPTNQDIVNLLQNLSSQINSHYNAQMSKINSLDSTTKLENFSKILTSIAGYNEIAAKQISQINVSKICKQDYQNVIDCTINKNNFTTDFMDISNLIYAGSAGMKGLPSFDQYLELAKSCSENANDADLVKKDCETLNRMTMEQYTLFYSCIMTGCLAKYFLGVQNYSEGKLDEDEFNSMKASVLGDMNTYSDKAKEVAKRYLEITETLKNLSVAKVSVNGKTTNMFSFGDAWAEVSENGGTMTLLRDWKTNSFASDIYYHKGNEVFKNGALYVKNNTVTFDLNGYSIIHNSNQKYDFCTENATLSIVDSSNKLGEINGVCGTGGTVKLNGVKVRNSSDAGIRVSGLTMNIDRSVISGCANSAIVGDDHAKITVDSTTFENNKKSALYNRNAEVTVKNSSFVNNSATENGGAIYNHYVLNISGCKFTGNKAKKGGAIYSDYNATISGSTFTGNSATDNGAAACFDYYGNGFCESFKISGSSFTGNSSGSNGGAIYCDSMNYLDLCNVEIKNNTAKSNGGGLYAQKGSASSCDPTISGKITIIDNRLTNGTKSNAFLGENSTSKCIFKITGDIDSSSRIGITSPTNDKDLDVVKIWKKDAYNKTSNIFSYDTGKYRINRYNPWYSEFFWVEIVKA